MSKLLVYLTALFFLLYGALFAVFPVDMANLITGSPPILPLQLLILGLRMVVPSLQSVLL